MDLLALTAEALRQPWRLWSGHLVHHDLPHLLGNVVALAVPFAMADGRTRRILLAALFMIAPVLGVLLLPLLDGGAYRGASGLACAAWALGGGLLLYRRESRWIGAALLLLLVAKVTWELLWTGPPWTSVSRTWAPLPAAHVLGALLGLAAAALVALARTVRRAGFGPPSGGPPRS
jgi:rhomboid family GlyGly-CTERM serine protease